MATPPPHPPTILTTGGRHVHAIELRSQQQPEQATSELPGGDTTTTSYTAAPLNLLQSVAASAADYAAGFSLRRPAPASPPAATPSPAVHYPRGRRDALADGIAPRVVSTPVQSRNGTRTYNAAAHPNYFSKPRLSTKRQTEEAGGAAADSAPAPSSPLSAGTFSVQSLASGLPSASGMTTAASTLLAGLSPMALLSSLPTSLGGSSVPLPLLRPASASPPRPSYLSSTAAVGGPSTTSASGGGRPGSSSAADSPERFRHAVQFAVGSHDTASFPRAMQSDHTSASGVSAISGAENVDVDTDDFGAHRGVVDSDTNAAFAASSYDSSSGGAGSDDEGDCHDYDDYEDEADGQGMDGDGGAGIDRIAFPHDGSSDGDEDGDPADALRFGVSDSESRRNTQFNRGHGYAPAVAAPPAATASGHSSDSSSAISVPGSAPPNFNLAVASRSNSPLVVVLNNGSRREPGKNPTPTGVRRSRRTGVIPASASLHVPAVGTSSSLRPTSTSSRGGDAMLNSDSIDVLEGGASVATAAAAAVPASLRLLPASARRPAHTANTATPTRSSQSSSRRQQRGILSAPSSSSTLAAFPSNLLPSGIARDVDMMAGFFDATRRLSESGASARLESTLSNLVGRILELTHKAEASATAVHDLESALAASRLQVTGLERTVGAQSRDISKLALALARAEENGNAMDSLLLVDDVPRGNVNVNLVTGTTSSSVTVSTTQKESSAGGGGGGVTTSVSFSTSSSTSAGGGGGAPDASVLSTGRSTTASLDGPFLPAASAAASDHNASSAEQVEAGRSVSSSRKGSASLAAPRRASFSLDSHTSNDSISGQIAGSRSGSPIPAAAAPPAPSHQPPAATGTTTALSRLHDRPPFGGWLNSPTSSLGSSQLFGMVDAFPPSGVASLGCVPHAPLSVVHNGGGEGSDGAQAAAGSDAWTPDKSSNSAAHSSGATSNLTRLASFASSAVALVGATGAAAVDVAALAASEMAVVSTVSTAAAPIDSLEDAFLRQRSTSLQADDEDGEEEGSDIASGSGGIPWSPLEAPVATSNGALGAEFDDTPIPESARRPSSSDSNAPSNFNLSAAASNFNLSTASASPTSAPSSAPSSARQYHPYASDSAAAVGSSARGTSVTSAAPGGISQMIGRNGGGSGTPVSTARSAIPQQQQQHQQHDSTAFVPSSSTGIASGSGGSGVGSYLMSAASAATSAAAGAAPTLSQLHRHYSNMSQWAALWAGYKEMKEPSGKQNQQHVSAAEASSSAPVSYLDAARGYGSSGSGVTHGAHNGNMMTSGDAYHQHQQQQQQLIAKQQQHIDADARHQRRVTAARGARLRLLDLVKRAEELMGDAELEKYTRLTETQTQNAAVAAAPCKDDSITVDSTTASGYTQSRKTQAGAAADDERSGIASSSSTFSNGATIVPSALVAVDSSTAHSTSRRSSRSDGTSAAAIAAHRKNSGAAAAAAATAAAGSADSPALSTLTSTVDAPSLPYELTLMGPLAASSHTPAPAAHASTDADAALRTRALPTWTAVRAALSAIVEELDELRGREFYANNARETGRGVLGMAVRLQLATVTQRDLSAMMAATEATPPASDLEAVGTPPASDLEAVGTPSARDSDAAVAVDEEGPPSTLMRVEGEEVITSSASHPSVSSSCSASPMGHSSSSTLSSASTYNAESATQGAAADDAGVSALISSSIASCGIGASSADKNTDDTTPHARDFAADAIPTNGSQCPTSTLESVRTDDDDAAAASPSSISEFHDTLSSFIPEISTTSAVAGGRVSISAAAAPGGSTAGAAIHTVDVHTSDSEDDDDDDEEGGFDHQSDAYAPQPLISSAPHPSCLFSSHCDRHAAPATITAAAAASTIATAAVVEGATGAAVAPHHHHAHTSVGSTLVSDEWHSVGAALAIDGWDANAAIGPHKSAVDQPLRHVGGGSGGNTAQAAADLQLQHGGGFVSRPGEEDIDVSFDVDGASSIRVPISSAFIGDGPLFAPFVSASKAALIAGDDMTVATQLALKRTELALEKTVHPSHQPTASTSAAAVAAFTSSAAYDDEEEEEGPVDADVTPVSLSPQTPQTREVAEGNAVAQTGVTAEGNAAAGRRETRPSSRLEQQQDECITATQTAAETQQQQQPSVDTSEFDSRDTSVAAVPPRHDSGSDDAYVAISAPPRVPPRQLASELLHDQAPMPHVHHLHDQVPVAGPQRDQVSALATAPAAMGAGGTAAVGAAGSGIAMGTARKRRGGDSRAHSTATAAVNGHSTATTAAVRPPTAATVAAGHPPSSSTTVAAARPPPTAATRPRPRRRGLRILSMDGGGIRGLLMLEMLKRIESDTGRRIHEIFDLIVGTSTGGFIAVALCQRATLEQIAAEYENIRTVFGGQSAILSEFRRFAVGVSHSTDKAEEVCRRFFGRIKMSDLAPSPKCVVVCAAVDTFPTQPFLFRSFELTSEAFAASEFLGTAAVFTHEAVRATTSAPTYYAPAVIGGQRFVDGAIVANNPVLIALSEAAILWPGAPVDVVVSLGTGIQVPRASMPTGVPSWIRCMLDLAMNAYMAHKVAATLLNNPGGDLVTNAEGDAVEAEEGQDTVDSGASGSGDGAADDSNSGSSGGLAPTAVRRRDSRGAHSAVSSSVSRASTLSRESSSSSSASSSSSSSAAAAAQSPAPAHRRYFRFDVEGVGEVDLSEWRIDALSKMLDEGRRYITRHSDRFNELALLLGGAAARLSRLRHPD